MKRENLRRNEKEYDALVRKRKKNPRLEMFVSLAGGFSILKITQDLSHHHRDFHGLAGGGDGEDADDSDTLKMQTAIDIWKWHLWSWIKFVARQEAGH